MTDPNEFIEALPQRTRALREEIAKTIVGRDRVIEDVLRGTGRRQFCNGPRARNEQQHRSRGIDQTAIYLPQPVWRFLERERRTGKRPNAGDGAFQGL